MDSIDPKAKIPAPGLEQTVITQKAGDKESQGERPGSAPQKKPGPSPPDDLAEEQSGEKPLIDILV